MEPLPEHLADLRDGRIRRLMGVFTGAEPPRIVLETVDPMFVTWTPGLEGYLAPREILSELEPELVEAFDRLERWYLVAHDTVGPGATGLRYVDFTTTEKTLADEIAGAIGGGVFTRSQLTVDDPSGCAEALELWEAGDNSRYSAWNERRSAPAFGGDR